MGIGTIELMDQATTAVSRIEGTGEQDVVMARPERGSCSESPTEARRVLIVDDDPEIRKMLEMSLRLEGIEVQAVCDGASALEAARTGRPDVILLDIMMPVLDGYAVMKHLRGFPSDHQIPVIVLSAKAGDEDVWQGWSCGADSYITKPLDLDTLFTEMDRVTSGRPPADLMSSGYVGA